MTDRRLTFSHVTPSVGAGATATSTTVLVVPRSTKPGVYRVIACADDVSRVTERQEANNCLTAPVALQILGGDVAVQSVAVQPASVRAGDRIAVTVIVGNAGALPVSAATVRHYLSANAVRDASDPPLIGTRRVGPLAPNASTAVAFDLTVPSTVVAGSYFVVTCAENLDPDRDASATNDCRATASPIQVTR